jgi:hypothetical protein
MDKIMSSCSFSSTSYAPSATALVAQVTVSAIKPTTTGNTSILSTAGQASPTAATPGKGARKDVWTVAGLSAASLVFLFGMTMI